MCAISVTKSLNSKASYSTIELPKEGDLPQQLERYLGLGANPCIKLICEPLKKININYFSYAKRYNDATYVYLTNMPSWQKYYFDKRYYLVGEFDDPHKKYPTGSFLWAGLSQHEIYNVLRNKFDIAHGITIIKNYQDCCEFFHFGSTIDNYRIVNFYLNNFEILKRFMLYFKDKAWEIITAIANCRIKIPDRETTVNNNNFTSEINNYLQFTKIERYYVSNERSDVYLTRREMESLKWYSMGKTAEEIGLILKLSKRTIESYLASAKNKINFYKKNSIGASYWSDIFLNIE
jgi:hypothetical protein